MTDNVIPLPGRTQIRECEKPPSVMLGELLLRLRNEYFEGDVVAYQRCVDLLQQRELNAQTAVTSRYRINEDDLVLGMIGRVSTILGDIDDRVLGDPLEGLEGS